MARRICLVALALALASVACGSRGAAPARTDRGARSALPDVSMLDSASLSDVSLLADAIDDRFESGVRTCMADHAYPQLVEAKEMEVVVAPLGRYDPVRIDPLDLGPYTEDQARRYGIVGTGLHFSDGEPGSVLSEDAAYDAAVDECRAAVRRQARDDVQALVARATTLRNEMRVEFARALRPGVDALVLERLACVKRNGYPSLDTTAVTSAATLEDSVAAAGITTGQLVEDRPARPALRPGQVVVVRPARAPRYTPSTDEVAFALVYVRCGEQLHVVDRLARLQRQPREDVVAAHELELVELGDRLKRVVQSISGEA